MACKRVTRTSTSNSIIGQFSELPLNELPLKKDVIRSYELKKKKLIDDGKITSILKRSICDDLSSEVLEIWQKASIPTVKPKNVSQMIERLADKYQKSKD